MSLTAEKNILKEIRGIKAEMKLHDTAAKYQAKIDIEKQVQVENRAQIAGLRKQIVELETGLKKLDVAEKIEKNSGTRVPVDQLVRKEVQVRREDGPYLKRDELESRFPVVVELDGRFYKVRIYGAQADVDSCAATVEVIASAEIEKSDLTELEAKVVAKNMEAFQAITKMHLVNFTINRRQLTLRGTKEAISASLDGIKKLASGQKVIKLESNMVSTIIGKKGVTITGMESKFSVVCKVSEKLLAPMLTISGPAVQVAKCAADYMTLIEENRIHEIEVEVDAQVVPYIFGKGGTRIRQMQVDSKARIDVPRGGSVIKIKGTKSQAAAAKALVEAAASQWEKENMSMTITADQMHALASNRAVLDALRPEVPECKVNPVYRANELKLRGSEEDVTAMRKVLDAWLAGLVIVKLKMHAEVTGKVIGSKGDVVNRIQKESKAAVKVEDELVTISGSKEAVALAKAQVDEILKVNQIAEVSVPVSYVGNFIGKGGEGVKKFQEEHSVAVDFPRKRDKSAPQQTVFLRGEAAPVVAAAKLLKQQVETFEKENKDIRLYPAVMGTVIGSKGAQIKKLEEESGCKLRCDSSSGLISIRGPEEAIPKAEALIIELVGAPAVMTDDSAEPERLPVPAGYIKHVVGRKYAVVHQLMKDHNVVIIVPRGKDVAHIDILGKPDAVKSAKAAILQLLDEVVRVKDTMDIHTKMLTNVFGDRMQELNRLRAAGVRIVVKQHEEHTKVSVVTIEGQRSAFQLAFTALKAAKAGNAMRSVRVLKAHLGSLRSSDRNLQRIEKEFGCKIQIDDASSSIIIVGRINDVGSAQRNVRVMLGFCYENSYDSRVLPASYMGVLFAKKAEILNNFERTHAKANPSFDRPTRVMALCGDAADLKAATDALDAILLEHSKENGEVSFNDATLIPFICGARFSTMNKVKEDCGCTRIDIDREQLVVQIRGPADSVVKAKAAVEALLLKASKERKTIPIDSAMVPTLIGKKGANIQAMEKEFECRIKVSRETRSVQLRGSEENIARACARIEEMKAALAKQYAEVEIDREMVPSLIGAKGATIQRLEKELGCRINVSKDSGTVVLRGGSEEKIEAARLHIEQLKKEFEERFAAEEAAREQRAKEEAEAWEVKKQAQKAANQKQDGDSKEMDNGHSEPVKREYASVPVGASSQDAHMSKNAKRRQRRRKKKNGTSQSAMDMLMGKTTTAGSNTKRGAKRGAGSAPAVSEAMQLLGLDAPSPPPGFEEPDAAEQYYSSSSGYTLRL